MNLTQAVSYFVEPGYIYFSTQPASIRTVLGSCVTVCLWDKRLKYGGMTHFLYPRTHVAAQATPRYGNVAIAALLRIMEEAGCRHSDIVAQIFGGAQPAEDGNQSGGEENVRVAQTVLSRSKITVISQDVGGVMGRKLVFDTGTGHVVVLKVHRVRQSDWLAAAGSRTPR